MIHARTCKKIPIATAMVLIVLGLLHGGTIRKKQDPILETQTDPIAYNQKMEEIKDGEKGPATPTFHFYDKEKFMTEPPADKNISPKAKEVLEARQQGKLEKEEPYESWEDTDAGESEVEPETLADAPETDKDDWWLEEWDEKEKAK